MGEFFREHLPTLGNLIQSISWNDILDIIIVAFLIYRLLTFVRRTNAINVIYGILALILVLWIAELLHLNVISYFIGKAFEMGLIALIIIFQPELRSLLESFGNGHIRRLFSWHGADEKEIEKAISQTVMACTEMSKAKIGALIVFEREISLDNYVATGTVVRAELSAQLLRNLFYPKAPLHDGAVIVRGIGIESAACVLPLSANSNLSKDLGTRHRAGVGISETSDCVVVIVSEETGAISVAQGGVLKRDLSKETLETILRKELIVEESKESGFLKGINLQGGNKG